MAINHRQIPTKGFRLSKEIKGREVGRAYLYVHGNEDDPQVAYLDHIDVDENQDGLACRELIIEAMAKARQHNCKRLIIACRQYMGIVWRTCSDPELEACGMNTDPQIPWVIDL